MSYSSVYIDKSITNIINFFVIICKNLSICKIFLKKDWRQRDNTTAQPYFWQEGVRCFRSAKKSHRWVVLERTSHWWIFLPSESRCATYREKTTTIF